MKETSEYLSSIVRTLPDEPGVYQYFDKEGAILYVGKAKSLRKRVASYFQKEHDNGKTEMLVRRIEDIKFIIVETELDALLLENNLIKKYQPRYNVMLKDDKTYPWICVSNERFPRIFSTRKVIRNGSQYFCPYASVKMMHALLDLINKLYPLRNCNFNLSNENIEKKKFKVCLEYHIGNCKGPCEGLQDEKEYNENIAQIKEILKGNISAAIRAMKQLMNEYSEKLEFEKAQDEKEYNENIAQIKEILKGNISAAIRAMKQLMNEYSEKLEFEKAQDVKEKLDLLENYQSRSSVVSPVINNVDVCTIKTDEK